MKLIITENAGLKAAQILKERLAANKNLVLGLPTGSTPLGMYKNIANMYKNGDIDLSTVTTFNLDEYVGLGAGDEQSYRYFMNENLFSHVNIKKENINIPNGKAEDLDAECAGYEARIKAAGGIDLFYGGVGENGHIAFNEPFSPKDSPTRVVDLTQDTIDVNARFFDNSEDVPRKALSMGVGTILAAREIVILALGSKKADALHAAFEESENPAWVISYLQSHPNAIIIADKAACSKLSEATLKRAEVL